MNNLKEVDIQIFIGDSDSIISENEIEKIKLLQKKRKKINKLKKIIKKNSFFEKISIESEKNKSNFILSPKKSIKEESKNNIPSSLSSKKSNSSRISLSKKLNKDEFNNFIPILSHKESFIKDFEEKIEKNILEIKTFFNIPKFYFQEPIKSSILISDFPGFDLIKKQ